MTNEAEESRNAKRGHEGDDIAIRPIVRFGLILFAGGVLVHLLVAGLLSKFAGHESRDAKLSLLAQDRLQFPKNLSDIPEPRLQESEYQDIAILRLYSQHKLKTYGWVDRKKGRVRIPIEQAMRLIASDSASGELFITDE